MARRYTILSATCQTHTQCIMRQAGRQGGRQAGREGGRQGGGREGGREEGWRVGGREQVEGGSDDVMEGGIGSG